MGSVLLFYLRDLKIRIDGHDSSDRTTPIDQNIGTHVSFSYLKNMTALTCDPHKYGLSPKGCSVLMFSDPAIQKSLYFGLTDWCGYLYATSLFSGSRSSALTSATWAHLMKFGKDGYRSVTEDILAGTKLLKDGINAIEGLKVVGNPQIGNIGCISTDKKLNIYELGNYLHKKGWAMPGIPKYPGLHLTIHPNNVNTLDNLIKLMKSGVNEVRNNPGKYMDGPCQLL
jgi:sphinganine-1-phosphate aldolase